MANELIERLSASPVVYREQRVITLRMMDELHGRPDGTAGRNFRENKQRLAESVDYFEVPYAEWSLIPLDDFRRADQTGQRNSMILLTESGYLLLVKSFRDDLAWEVQRALVAVYFRAKQTTSGDVLLDSLKSLVILRESQIVLERKTAIAVETAGEAKELAQAVMARVESNHGYFSVLAFARMRGMEMPKSEAQRHGKQLSAVCRHRGIPVHKLKDERYGEVNTYPESILEEHFGGRP